MAASDLCRAPHPFRPEVLCEQHRDHRDHGRAHSAEVVNEAGTVVLLLWTAR
jgi:hypothetical protein